LEDTVLGVDLGKREFHVSLLIGERVYPKTFPNSDKGFRQLQAWLKTRHAGQPHICVEATGGFAEAFALRMHELGYLVSIVNPSRIKAYGRSELLRTKTDAADAALIARFCRAHRPPRWNPPPQEIQLLQALVRRREAILAMRQQEQNRLESPNVLPTILTSIEELIGSMDRALTSIEAEIAALFSAYQNLRKQRDLLITIPGIGETTAARILGDIPEITEFRSGKSVAAYVGLSPRHYQSGNMQAKSRLCKTGNSKLRKALYFPAITAMRYHPALRIFASRLRDAGKARMLIVAAVMRKLLVLAYAILKSKQPYRSAIAA
jgi:transposase